ncbi:carboxypeptidase-like regulatory domain-containing protein [Sinomicrobium weinanense]|uniref:Carboxypeptidase-like regulatory domain-containing protein n=1 Tax=Sinomicrobium weinanense TaxID=2842200 RepID=A0A926Q3K1_9FLAO|nr:carboxypeptidase-like regulatory domain-containing protein [Sinomicrobium weinanense]MBC9797648.1 carboxypeptidase-like regulatory domain-containing protein [Sinomicrobium weinanense]MBU3122670.1 carboxypeptidase-like regulatory domain-containing protein [Sinomicrobium weinanense]
MQKILLILALICTLTTYAQNDERVILRGKVLYRNTSVANQNVINITTEKATTTNQDGEFEILVKSGDQVVFSAVNYQLKSVKINDDILKNNRLVVEVNEKVTELDEVVITPENREKFLELKGEEFKQFDYEGDYSSNVPNMATPEHQLQNGVNFVNIFKALFLSKKEAEEGPKKQLKVSEVLRQVYDDEFFVLDLKVPQDKIDDFLYYCDTKIPRQSLLRKDNEFELIEFLVKQSEDYRKSISE